MFSVAKATIDRTRCCKNPRATIGAILGELRDDRWAAAMAAELWELGG